MVINTPTKSTTKIFHITKMHKDLGLIKQGSSDSKDDMTITRTVKTIKEDTGFSDFVEPQHKIRS